ncbi:hypothetical protein VTN96DRAFT_7360 [Rasamsonia emersonii]
MRGKFSLCGASLPAQSLTRQIPISAPPVALRPSIHSFHSSKSSPSPSSRPHIPHRRPALLSSCPPVLSRRVPFLLLSFYPSLPRPLAEG